MSVYLSDKHLICLQRFSDKPDRLETFIIGTMRKFTIALFIISIVILNSTFGQEGELIGAFRVERSELLTGIWTLTDSMENIELDYDKNYDLDISILLEEDWLGLPEKCFKIEFKLDFESLENGCTQVRFIRKSVQNMNPKRNSVWTDYAVSSNVEFIYDKVEKSTIDKAISRLKLTPCL